MTTGPIHAVYDIPGTFLVTYQGDLDAGRIVRMVFMPSASDAGYFGEAAQFDFVVGDDDDSPDAAGLNVEDVDGPFWKAIQTALTPVTVVPMNVGQDEEWDWEGTEHERTTIPIGWEE